MPHLTRDQLGVMHAARGCALLQARVGAARAILGPAAGLGAFDHRR